MKKLAIVALTGLVLTGCQTTQGQQNLVGPIMGAVTGGLLGSTIGSGSGTLWATGAGAV